MAGDGANVPELRFPGFEGEWSIAKLGYGIDLISGQHLAPDQYSTISGEVPYFTGPSDFSDDLSRVKKWSDASNNMGEVGDVLITVKGSGVGELILLKLPAAVIGRQLMAVRSNGFETALVGQFLQTKRRYLSALASGNMIPGLSRNDIISLPYSAGLLPEQQKIATFLGAVDGKIGQLEKKKALLENYKKGCMQKLFSRTLRFKDDNGNDFPDWEEKRLGDVASRVKTKNDPIKVADVLTNSAINGVVRQIDYFDHAIANADNLDRYTIVEVGDFVYNPRISVTAPVGPIKRNELIRGVMSPLYDVFRFEEYETDFWKHYYASTTWHKYMKQVANYGARHDRMAISSDDFINMPLPYPTLKEQQKIANFLTAIDDKITLTTTQLTQAQTFKKGLLQQMFV